MTDRPPILFLVDADPEARRTTASVLSRRFGPDYRVVTADTAEAGLDELRRLARDGEDVALVAADLHLPTLNGVDFLEHAHAVHPRASRVLLVAMDDMHTRIPLRELAALQLATALGRIDFAIVKGWVTPEEWLYPRVQDALSAWTVAHRVKRVASAVGGGSVAVGSVHRYLAELTIEPTGPTKI